MDAASHPPSPNLLEIYNRLYTVFGPQHWWPADSPFEVIVGAILAQNTAWKNVEKAITSLKQHAAADAPQILTPEGIHRISEETLSGLIRSSGFYHVKARRLKAFITFLYDACDGTLAQMFSRDSNSLREQLLSVKGLGPETVDAILLYAGNLPYFVVDAYTRRVFSRHGWIAETASYSEIQHFFMERLLPDVRLFNEYHALIVNVSKVFCKTKPDCEQCPLQPFFEQEGKHQYGCVIRY